MLLLGARHEMKPPFHMLLYEASEDGNCILLCLNPPQHLEQWLIITADDKKHILLGVMNVFNHGHCWTSFQNISDFLWKSSGVGAMACQQCLSMISVRTQPLKEPKFPTSKIRGGSWTRGAINQKSTDVSLLSDIPGVQEAEIPQFFLPPMSHLYLAPT